MNRFAVCFTSAQLALAANTLANTAPAVIIKSATMRGATGLMDVVFRVNDPDDATVKTRALAFIDGQRSFAKVIKPTTFAEGTGAKLGDASAANTDHTLTWNVAADWNISLGLIKFEILAMDGRGLLPLNWVTIPAANGQPELTISKNAPTDQEVLDALFWQYASGDPGLVLEDGVLRGSPASGILESAVVADGPSAKFYGPVYILKQMDLAVAHEGNTERCTAARIELSEPLRWRALRKPFELFQPGVVWGNNGNVKPIAGLAGVTAIASGVALTRTGEVFAWRTNDLQPIPQNVSGVVSIAQSGGPCLALKNDGTCIVWGNDLAGTNGLQFVPETVKNITQIAAGYQHFLALRQDGTVVSWGNNDAGQFVPPSEQGIAFIAANYYYSAAVRANGTISYWPQQLSQEDRGPFKSVSLGDHSPGAFSVGFKQDGTAITTGFLQTPQPFVPSQSPISDIISTSTSDQGHILLLKKDGTVIAWGANDFGQCDVPPGLSDVNYIYAGSGFSIALKKAPRQP